MAHHGKDRLLANLEVRQLGFFKIASNPKRAGVYQGYQLHTSSDIGALARIHVSNIAVDRGKDFGVAKVQSRHMEICPSRGQLRLSSGEAILSVLKILHGGH
jgi:hypothetical protein